MSLIHKMNVGNTDYDIQDRLMPDAIGQAGQVLKVKDDGSGLEFATIESSEKLYQHCINVTAQFDGRAEENIACFSFLIVSSYDSDYTDSDFVDIFNTYGSSDFTGSFTTYGSSFVALLTIRLPESGSIPYRGIGSVYFSDEANVLEVRAYYSINDSVKEYYNTGSADSVIRLSDTVTEL